MGKRVPDDLGQQQYYVRLLGVFFVSKSNTGYIASSRAGEQASKPNFLKRIIDKSRHAPNGTCLS